MRRGWESWDKLWGRVRGILSICINTRREGVKKWRQVLRCCLDKLTQELSHPLSSASPDLSAILAFLNKTLTEFVRVHEKWQIEQQWVIDAYSHQQSCNTLFCLVGTDTLFVLRSYALGTTLSRLFQYTLLQILYSWFITCILHLGRKEDEVHCNVHDLQKHIKCCNSGLIRMLCFSENSLRCSLFFPAIQWIYWRSF